MHSNSVQLNTLTTQQPLWKDDPFDLTKNGFFKEPKKVDHDRNLQSYIQDLITKYGNQSNDSYTLPLSFIPNDKLLELSRLYIEFTDREVTECVNGNDFSVNNEYTTALLSMLNDNCKAKRDAFAQIAIKNILTYYSDSLQELIDEECEKYFEGEMEYNGLRSYSDDENETFWSR